MSLEITVLENEIAVFNGRYTAALNNGDIEMERMLHVTIARRGKYLNKLLEEELQRDNQPFKVRNLCINL